MLDIAVVDSGLAGVLGFFLLQTLVLEILTHLRLMHGKNITQKGHVGIYPLYFQGDICILIFLICRHSAMI